VWVDRGGRATPVDIEANAFAGVALSPEGQRLALAIFKDGLEHIHVHDLSTGTTTQLTFESTNQWPVWSRDGREIIFTTSRDGPYDVYRVPVDLSRNPAPVITGPEDQVAFDCSPDGSAILVFESELRVLAVTPGTGGPPTEIQLTRGRNDSLSFSPDGRWIAFVSDVSGRREVYATRYPGPAGIQQVSTSGGTRPLWSPTGDELFFISGEAVMAVAVRPDASDLNVDRPRQLFQYPSIGADRTIRNWAYDARSERFLMIEPSDQEMWHDRVMVVTNWFEELNRLVPTE
jgi:Tol biopolymer transport system component